MRWKILLLGAFFALPTLAAPAQPVGASKAISNWPDGAGDPDATTCRPPQRIPEHRLPGPEVCKLNSEWALLRKNRQDISADGRQIIPDPRGSNIAPMNCSVVGGGATTGGGTMSCQ